ncbi:GFA family protein [Xanthomonas axonopodis pv. poinsettiicola]|uniref:GFA family protein n=1 Tax=Xanthomonas TaxID=338 RepID=UPI001E55F713|nr:GFA family protein [Xanthomonas codiaei]MCC8536739.1 GFA family protein [Xanthomonas codiaei]
MQYAGSCHCGRIAFELETDAPITEVYDCNCSLCRRRGGLLWFGARSQLQLQAVAQEMGSYRFNRQHIAHHYCMDCGIAPFSEGANPNTGEANIAVNVRCIPDLDLSTLSVQKVDGARL